MKIEVIDRSTNRQKISVEIIPALWKRYIEI
nr:MAG TPA: hypothetical protein [Caudoviricetes sp.]